MLLINAWITLLLGLDLHVALGSALDAADEEDCFGWLTAPQLQRGEHKPTDETHAFSMLVKLIHTELVTENMISDVASYRFDYIHSGASPHTV